MEVSKKRMAESKYDHQFKVAIGHEYLTTELGYKRLADKHGIPKSSVQAIVRWYKKRYPDGADKAVTEPPKVPVRPDNDSLKVIALQMLIENASKELGIDLVKKFGTKQSGK